MSACSAPSICIKKSSWDVLSVRLTSLVYFSCVYTTTTDWRQPQHSMTGRFSHVEIVMKPPRLSRKRAAEGDGLEVMSIDAFSKTCDPIWTSPHKRVKKNGGDDTSSPSSDDTSPGSGNDELGINGVGEGPEGEQRSNGTRPQGRL